MAPHGDEGVGLTSPRSTLTVPDTELANASWTYRHPAPLARRIKNHVAFGPGVRIETDQIADRPER